MGRICLVVVAGLDRALLERTPTLGAMGSMAHVRYYRPVFPAVTSTVQATLTTGMDAEGHGIICNGLYTHGNASLHAELDLTNHAEARREVSFWEQSNGLLQAPRFWRNSGKKVAMLFWQNSMPSPKTGEKAADIVITPKPVHTPDGKTLTACWSDPPDLYERLMQELGPFPLHNYWSPMAGLPSSQWIARAAQRVWERERPDLQLVYIPHLDFNLQRLGPGHPALIKDLQDVDLILEPLARQVRADGGTLVIAGDYGMHEVHQPILPNLALRQAGLLSTRLNAEGKGLVDYEASAAFAMVDHQVANVYLRKDADRAKVIRTLQLPGIAQIEEPGETDRGRGGQLVLIASEEAWFAHDWWESDQEKPRWQFSVDIHNKPGFDPRELFFDPARKCIAQDPGLVKGSHGLTGDPQRWPMLLSDVPMPQDMAAEKVAGWLKGLLG
jgi:predicted AlkP superfamily pyrophosphatase or phosphodiesterase